MKVSEVIDELKGMASPVFKEGMERYAIDNQNALGIRMPQLRSLAKEIGKNQHLSTELWKSTIHEAKILATLIGEPKKVSESQMDEWVRDFNSWDVCDQCVINLFRKHPLAKQKALEWSKRDKEFEKRAGFALMATLAVHQKKEKDEYFFPFYDAIKQGSTDERNFVKKAVNWALRQIGKRNRNLNKLAINLCKELLQIDSKTAHWIASDALTELTSEKVQSKLNKM